MKINIEIDYAPDGKGKEFEKWCEKHSFDVLNSGRRAWCTPYSSYFRGALGVATTESGESFLIYEEDLEKGGEGGIMTEEEHNALTAKLNQVEREKLDLLDANVDYSEQCSMLEDEIARLKKENEK